LAVSVGLPIAHRETETAERFFVLGVEMRKKKTEEVKVTDEGRGNFTIIPNIVDDMGLSLIAFRLYVHLKRVAGDNGDCYQSTQTLAEKCGMGVGTISKAKQELQSAGLIKIQSRAKENTHYHNITIANIWRENAEKYVKANSPDEIPSSPDEQACSPSEFACSPSETIKNPINKNPINKSVSSDKADGNPHREMLVALASLSGFDIKLHGGRLGKSAKKLISAGYSLELIKNAYSAGGWWYKNDWRGQKGEMPTPEQIIETIGKVPANVRPNGTGKEPQKVRIQLPNGEIVETLA